MEQPKETAQTSGKLSQAPGASGSGRMVSIPSIKDGRGSMVLNLEEARAKTVSRKPQDMLIWKGRARRFSLGMLSRRVPNERPLDATRIQVTLVNAGSSEMGDETPPGERKEPFSGMGVGHTSVSLENAYFRRMCGAEDTPSFGPMTTNRERHDSAREGHTSLASVVTQRYKAQVGVDWSPSRSTHAHQASSSPRPSNSARRHSPKSSLDTLGLSLNPSVSVVVETIESKRSQSSTRSPRSTGPLSSPHSYTTASDSVSPTVSLRRAEQQNRRMSISSETISDAPRRTSPSSPALSSSRVHMARSEFRSRSLSAPYFATWSYGNVDVSHKLYLNTHQTAKQLIRAKLQSAQNALFAKIPHFVAQSPNSVSLAQLSKVSRDDAAALFKALGTISYRKDLVVERNDSGRIILAGDQKGLVLALLDEYFYMPDHLEVILYTHAAWIPREFLLQHLTGLYKNGLESMAEIRAMCELTDVREAVVNAAVHRAVKSRVMEVLHAWIETCPTDFAKGHGPMFDMLERFLNTVMESDSGTDYNVAELVMGTLHLAVRVTGKTALHARAGSSALAAPKIKLKQRDPKRMSALDFSPAQLATQLTIRDSRLLKTLTAAQLVAFRHTQAIKNTRTLLSAQFESSVSEISVGSSVKNREFEARHSHLDPVTASLLSTQKFVGWIVTEVVTSPNLNARAVLLGNLIEVAHRCYELRNYHSTHCIYSALSTQAVSRLSDTWKALSAEHSYMWSKLGARVPNLLDFFDECVAAPSPKVMPIIPSMQLLAQQAAAGDHNRPRGASARTMVNFAKFRSFAQILKPLLMAHQQISYPFGELTSQPVQTFLESHLTFLPFEQLLTCSKNIEHGPIASEWRDNSGESSADDDDDDGISTDSMSSEEERSSVPLSKSLPSRGGGGIGRARSTIVTSPMPLYKIRSSSGTDSASTVESGSSQTSTTDETHKSRRTRPRSNMIAGDASSVVSTETSSVKSVSNASAVSSSNSNYGGSSVSSSSSNISVPVPSRLVSSYSHTRPTSPALPSSPAQIHAHKGGDLDVSREQALKDLQNEVRGKWTRPWAQCSVGSDLPRFVRKMVIVNEVTGEVLFSGGSERGGLETSAEGNSSSANISELICDAFRAFAIVLDAKKDSKAIEKSLDLYFGSSHAGANVDVAKETDRFCREILGDNSRVTSLLKVAASQGIVAPAWTKLRLFILSRFGFKDVKRGWLIAISFTDSKVTVIHRRREASNEETTGVPNFEFSWEFSMTFTRKMDKLEHASFSIVNMNVSPTMNERSLATLKTTVQEWYYPGTDAFPCLSLFPVATTPIIPNSVSLQSSWVSASIPSSSSKKDKKRKSIGSRTREFLGRQLKHSSQGEPSSSSTTITGPHVSISETYMTVAIPSTPTKSKPKLKTYLSNDSTTTAVDSASNDSGSTNATSGVATTVAAASVVETGPKRANLVRRLSDSSEAFASNRRKGSFVYEEASTPTKLSLKRKSGNLTDGEDNSKEISKSKSKSRRNSELSPGPNPANAIPTSGVSFEDSPILGVDIPSVSSTPSKKKKRSSESKVRSKRSKSIGSANSQPSILIDSIKGDKETSRSVQVSVFAPTPPLRASADDVMSMEEDADDDDFDGDQGLDESEKSMSWSTDSSWSSIETRSSNAPSTGSTARKRQSRDSRNRTLSSDSEGRAPNQKIRQTIRPQTSTGSPSTPVLAQHSSPNFYAALTSTSVPDHGPHPALSSFSSPHFGSTIGLVHVPPSMNSAAPAPLSPTNSRRRLEDTRFSSTSALLGSSHSLTSSSNTILSSAGTTPGSPNALSDAGSRSGKDESQKDKYATPTKERKKSISSTTREGLYSSTPSTKERKDKDKRKSDHFSEK